VFSEYQKSPFYITGESYAGKYIPAIGNKIHVSNPTADMKINIVGFALGDALIDPEHIFPGYADLLFNIGMLDASEAEYFRDETAKAINLIQNKQFKDAFDIFDYLMNGDIYKYPTYLYNATGTNNYYNFLLNDAPPEFGYYASFLNSLETRKAIHVGSAKFNDGADVEMALINDITDSMSDEFVVLLENYKVLLYNGQLDIIVGAPLTENYLQQLKWSGQEKYLNSDKRVWRIGTEPVGFIRQVGNFQQIVVRNAGHILPFDQPEVALEMIKNFVNS
jgi:vitellogenic carboxypeptidase-like protein